MSKDAAHAIVTAPMCEHSASSKSDSGRKTAVLIISDGVVCSTSGLFCTIKVTKHQAGERPGDLDIGCTPNTIRCPLEREET